MSFFLRTSRNEAIARPTSDEQVFNHRPSQAATKQFPFPRT